MTFISIDQAMRERRRESRNAKAPRQHANGSDPRPVIRLESNNLEEVVDQAEEALIASDRGLYQRGNKIVSVGEVKLIAADKREVVAQRIFERGDHALLEDLTSAAIFEKWDGRKGDYKVVEPPMKVIHVLKDRTGRLRFPILTAVINCPTLREDGSLLDRAGYDASTGLLLDPGSAVFDAIPAEPSRSDAEAALLKLDSLIDSFPFVSDADRSVSLAAMMTAPVRRSLSAAPMFGFNAFAAGSGKTKNANMVSILATGREAGVIAQGKSEEEMEKRLGAVLMAGDPVIAIDNVEQPLGGDLLCQMLTQATVRCRILGRSETPELPTGALVTATGNALTLVGDMTRRALLCTLDPQVERPELRVFDNDPVADIKAGRCAYVVAILIILRAYIVAGRPRQCDPLGSFEEWSGLVRSALIWLGRADPCQTMETVRALDPKRSALQAVIAQWAKVIGTERTTVRNVIAKATEKTSANNFDFNPSSFMKPDFREALLAVAGVGGAINSRKLGSWISSHKNTIVSVVEGDTDEEKTPFPPPLRTVRWRFQAGTMRDGLATWYLEEMASQAAVSLPEFG